jgi:hypothetical protein
MLLRTKIEVFSMRRCNQFLEHLLMETISDTTYLTCNVDNFSDPMWNL